MNQREQKAYDALGRVQEYFRTHGVARLTLWQGKGESLDHHNGEDNACIWGALIATGAVTESQYYSRSDASSLDLSVIRALSAVTTSPEVRFAGDNRRRSVVSQNDSYIRGDLSKMRIWLRQARGALKAGRV